MEPRLEAADLEPEFPGERLELLAVVRGLEALDQPSRVTLVTPSKYVHRGLLYGLDEWRTNGWSWEHFGQMVPVKNRDLWQRLDRALGFHELDIKHWRVDAPAPTVESTMESPAPQVAPAQATESASARVSEPDGKPSVRKRVWQWSDLYLGCELWLSEQSERFWLWLAQCGTQLLPLPWLR